jgi:3-isopropylmalate/(R)-2-methylmalate dehydratase small subunit
MSGLETLSSTVCPLNRDDVDTDQIIPARFLKATTKEGIGEGLFADWAREPGFPTRDPRFAGARILVAGRNFGCGSSREHAAWALAQNGFRVVIARSFADIFRQNALKNGILPLALADAEHAALIATIEADPLAVVTVDLPSGKVTFSATTALFQVEPFAKQCLIEGVDELGYILARMHLVQAYEATFEG